MKKGERNPDFRLVFAAMTEQLRQIGDFGVQITMTSAADEIGGAESAPVEVFP